MKAQKNKFKNKIIGINGLFLSKPFTGIGAYTINLLRSLSEIDKKNKYIIVVPNKSNLPTESKLLFKQLPPNYKFINSGYPKVPTASLKKTLWEQMVVPKIFRQNNVNVAFFPYPSNPCSKFKIPTIVTVHDTIPFDDKDYTKKIRSKLYQSFVKRNLKYADKIIAVSNKTKSDLIKHGINSNIIEVIYNTLGPLSKIKYSEKSTILKKFNISKPYFLYVGGYDKRKNVKRLVEAFKSANSQNKFQLILAGNALHKDKLYESFAEFDTQAGSKPQKSHKSVSDIIITGFISRENLNALYKNSYAFINFSLNEGFNVPLIEAAHFKTPIGTSNIKVHKEVIAKGAIYANPQSIKDIFTSITELMNISKAKKADLLKAASKSLQNFNYLKEAKKIIKLFKTIS